MFSPKAAAGKRPRCGNPASPRRAQGVETTSEDQGCDPKKEDTDERPRISNGGSARKRSENKGGCSVTGLSEPPRERAKPLKSRGKRNLLCKHYDYCLSLAIKREWATFSCSRRCPWIRSYEPPSPELTAMLKHLGCPVKILAEGADPGEVPLSRSRGYSDKGEG
jgi:hypothetical protein